MKVKFYRYINTGLVRVKKGNPTSAQADGLSKQMDLPFVFLRIFLRIVIDPVLSVHPLQRSIFPPYAFEPGVKQGAFIRVSYLAEISQTLIPLFFGY